jgi:FAD/FMN-containing dehydrogenase
MSTAPASLLSWGNYPAHPQRPHALGHRDELPLRLSRAAGPAGPLLAYGAGLSYGDSCLGARDEVLATRGLDRFLSADWTSGRVAVEAGMTLEELLRLAIPRGWFLPVTPGTKYVTLGGAVANDVHGKNHHLRGTFGCHVRSLGLVRSDLGAFTCSPSEQPEYFAATIGGLGLTGLIAWVDLQLVPIKSSRIQRFSVRFGGLDEFFELSEQQDARHEFCVSWIDCAARGEAAGRGVYLAGDFAPEGGLNVAQAPRFTVPFTPPFSLVGNWSLRAFNAAYWRRAPARPRRDACSYDGFFYPLDSVLRWNRIYGPAGFQQYQALIPAAEARGGIRALLDEIARSGTGSFLAVLKRCGDVRSPGVLSFPRPGTTLALDFPQTPELGLRLFPRLNAIVRETGGRLYPAKDAQMSGVDFRAAYPAWEQVERLRDPALLSRFWQRILP